MPKPSKAVRLGHQKIFSGWRIQAWSRYAHSATAIAAISGSTISRSLNTAATPTMVRMKVNAAA